MIITLEKYEGNSKIGVPVFSNMVKKSNFKYKVFQPSYEERKALAKYDVEETETEQQINRYEEMETYFTKESVNPFSDILGENNKMPTPTLF